MSTDHLTSYGTFLQLLHALENARNQLAVAIACEGKRTVPEKWNGYIETGQRAARCLRRLRSGAGDREGYLRWRCALEILRASPRADERSGESEAGRLCGHLVKALRVLEGAADPNDEIRDSRC